MYNDNTGGQPSYNKPPKQAMGGGMSGGSAAGGGLFSELARRAGGQMGGGYMAPMGQMPAMQSASMQGPLSVKADPGNGQMAPDGPGQRIDGGSQLMPSMMGAGWGMPGGHGGSIGSGMWNDREGRATDLAGVMGGGIGGGVYNNMPVNGDLATMLQLLTQKSRY